MPHLKPSFLNRTISWAVCTLVVVLFNGVAKAESIAGRMPNLIIASHLADVIVRIEHAGKSKYACLVFQYDAKNTRYLKSSEFSIISHYPPSHGIVNVQADRLYLAWERESPSIEVVARVYSLDGKIINEIKLSAILNPKQFDIFVSDRKKIGSDLTWLKSIYQDLDGNAVLETSVGAENTLIVRDVTIRPDGTIIGER